MKKTKSIRSRLSGRTKQHLDLTKVFDTGAVRWDAERKVRFDLICPSAIRRYAQTCAEGAAKYGDRNWEKGIPTGNYLDHAVDHLLAFMQGDVSEDHLGHALWNVAAAIHNEEKCKHALGQN